MAVTSSAQVVSVGVAGVPAGDQLAEVADALAAAGLSTVARVLIEDDEAALERALAADVALTIVVAGPGGSTGDVVRRTLARLAGVRLVLSARMLAALEAAAQRRDRPLPRRDDRRALLPQGAVLWAAPDAEPAWMLEAGGRAFVVLPRGDVSEAIEAQLAGYAQARLGGRGEATRTLRVAGPGVAEVEERLADWLGPASGGGLEVTTMSADGEVWVRLRARGASPTAAAEALGAAEGKIRARLGDDCYGRDDESLERVVGRLLVERQVTVAVAESCTGGLLGHRLTGVPGSSRYFERGVVVYSNQAKQELLGVPADVLSAHGAVSGPCAAAMAAGVRQTSRSDCALAITGIAGPDGGTPTKPVGTVFVGVAVGAEVTAHRFHFPGDRAAIKWQAAQAALDLLRRRLLEGAR
ncbi:MAG: nicotinamide-nucleotide amidohydrolase family protein [Candidatus Rokuibacteriota bacterium]